MKSFKLLCISLAFLASLSCLSQDLQPGLSGMAPTRWMTIKSTHAPRRVYQTLNAQSKTYTQEDLYFRAWIPAIIKPRFALAFGPHYRTEQLELKTTGEDPVHQLSNWKLRSMGVDMKSLLKLDSTSWLITTAQVNQSGNLNSSSNSTIPFSYTLSAVYLRKKSLRKEIGFGLMVNKSNSIMVLPVFVFNYNYSLRAGVEISLPHKIAWRYHLTSSDIVYLKSEAVTRTYFITGADAAGSGIFRRIDIDMGVAYNKALNRFVGVELFAGYRQNVSYRLPDNITAIKNSGWAASLEIYIRPPQGLRLNNKRK